MTDLFAEYRRELPEKLAYEYWEERGRPFGSPEIDWFAAEKTVRSSLSDSGAGFPCSDIQLEPNEGPYR
jgi:Protein of unknown function (DUF2934)